MSHVLMHRYIDPKAPLLESTPLIIGVIAALSFERYTVVRNSKQRSIGVRSHEGDPEAIHEGDAIIK